MVQRRTSTFHYFFLVTVILIWLFPFNCFAQSCPPAKVILQPFDFSVCNTGNALFYIKANDASRYQWQINNGAGWVDLNDNNMYQGTTKDTLSITGVIQQMTGNLFRCQVFSTCGNDVSFPGSLSIVHPVPPQISIEHINTSECTGVPVGYFSKTSKGGLNPTFNWYVNTIDVGNKNPTFISSTLKEGDVVQCIMTSNATCITAAYAFSNFDTVHFAPTVIPTVSILEADTVICQGSTAPSTFTVLVFNGGNDPDFKWTINGKSTGLNSNILSTVGLKSGDTLRVTMTSKDPCAKPTVVTSKDMILDITPSIFSTLSISTADTIVCKGDKTSFIATPSNVGNNKPIYNWLINDKIQTQFDSIFSTSLLNEGDVISCLLTSKTPCFKAVFSNSIKVHVKEGPKVTYPSDTLILVGSSVQLLPSISGDVSAIEWQPSTYLDNNTILSPVSTPLHTVTYTLKTTSTTGCSVLGTTTIKVIDHIIIPNVFSPNNDGINDRWEIQGLSTFLDCKVQVFNRYGQIVYSSVGYNTPWDGTSKGRHLPSGIYYYIIETKTDKKLFNGYVGLLR